MVYRQINGLKMTYTYNGVSPRNEEVNIMPFSGKAIEIEIIMLNKISQTERKKFCMLMS